MKKNIIIFLLIFTYNLFTQNYQWSSTGIGGGGAFFNPSINPHNPNQLYVVSDMSGVYHTTDFGESWKMINYENLCATTLSQVQFTSNPSVLYCINNKEIEFIRKPYKSLDGGLTWIPLYNDPTNGEPFYLFADDQNENRLILSNYGQFFFSSDGGNTFQMIYQNNTGFEDAGHIAGVFWDESNIYIGTSRGVLASTDNGANFSFLNLSGIPSDEGIVSFTGAKENGAIRFFCVTLPLANIWPGITGDGYWNFRALYKLDLSTTTQWVNSFLQPQNIRPFFIDMARNDVDVVYIAGGNTDTGFPFVFKSTDGGISWVDVFLTENNQNIITGWSGWQGDYNWWWGGYVLGLSVSNSNSNYVVFSDLGYVHGTTDGGITWQQMYVSSGDENPMNNPTPKRKSYKGIGLENTTCWWINWIDINNIIAGFSDITAIRTTDGGLKWSKNYYNFDYNSVYQMIKNPSNDFLYAATSSVHDMYESHRLTDDILDSGNGEIMYSTDNGINWQTLHNFNHPVVWMAFDPNNSNKMYASVVHSSLGGIYVSNDIQNGSASTWTKLNNPPRTEGHPQNIFVLNDGTLVCSYSGRINNDGSFTSSSGVFVSADNGNSWVDVSHNDMQWWVRDIYIDPNDANQNTWYVSVFSGWGGDPNNKGGLFKTTNRGMNWQRLNNNYRVATCSVNPNNPNQLFFTTESEGLWKSENINISNPTFERVESYPFKHPHRVFFNPYYQNQIWVVSFGGGLFYSNISTSVEDDLNKNYYFTLEQNYPNPFNPLTKISWQSPLGSYQTLKIYDVLGSEVATIFNEYKCAGNYEIEFDGSDLPSGVYFYRLTVGDFSETKSMILLK